MRWVREAGSHRPFVKLGDGRLAFIDTGSTFGFAFEPMDAVILIGRRSASVTILAADEFSRGESHHRESNIGALVLNGVPTDVLTGAAPGTPIILGRRALFPFRITFDPVARADLLRASRTGLAYNGMFPCFLGGLVSRLFSSKGEGADQFRARLSGFDNFVDEATFGGHVRIGEFSSSSVIFARRAASLSWASLTSHH